MSIRNGMNALHADTSVLNLFGTTITHGDWVSLTSRVSYGEETTMGISVLVVRSVLTGTMFWAEFMLAMNRTTPYVEDGNCFGKSRAI